MASRTAAWTTVVTTASRRTRRSGVWPTDPLPPPWPDCSVRRFLDVPFRVAAPALVELHAELLGGPRADRVQNSVVQGGAGWLTFARADTKPSGEEWWWPGGLHLWRCGRPVPVEIVLAAWSPVRSELRLQLRCQRRLLHLPDRYFDVAHLVVDRLRAGIEIGLARQALSTVVVVGPWPGSGSGWGPGPGRTLYHNVLDSDTTEE